MGGERADGGAFGLGAFGLGAFGAVGAVGGEESGEEERAEGYEEGF